MIAPGLVYVLCFITCVVCAVLLVRSWLRTRTRLLMWAGLSFVCLAFNNLFLLIDTTFPEVDLTPLRMGAALLGVTILVIGLISESD